MPILTHLEPLDRQALRSIMTEPKNSIVKQYVKMFEIDGVKLKFEDDVLDYVVDKAVEFGLGARGLRSLIETIMMEAMFEVPSTGVKTYKVTLEYAQRRVENANIAVLKESTEDR